MAGGRIETVVCPRLPVTAGVGFGAGDIQGMSGRGAEISFNDGLGGLSASFNDQGQFNGAGFHVGPGYDLGGGGTITRSYTIRDAAGYVLDTWHGR